jgi:hypothetical protein
LHERQCGLLSLVLGLHAAGELGFDAGGAVEAPLIRFASPLSL